MLRAVKCCRFAPVSRRVEMFTLVAGSLALHTKAYARRRRRPCACVCMSAMMAADTKTAEPSPVRSARLKRTRARVHSAIVVVVARRAQQHRLALARSHTSAAADRGAV